MHTTVVRSLHTAATWSLTIAVTTGVLLRAQETKPVPKDSVRVSVAGCTKGYVFTAGPRLEGQPDTGDIPEGMHLRMNGQKATISEIKAHEGSMVLITGLMRKGQYRPDGIGIGGGVRVSPVPAGQGAAPNGPFLSMIDVEGWRPLPLACPSRK